MKTTALRLSTWGRSLLVASILAVLAVTPALAQTSIFSIQNSPSPNTFGNTLIATAALSTTDAWAVGYQNDNNLNFSRTLTVHWDGQRWRTIPSPNPGSPPRCNNSNSGNYLNAIAAVASDDVWAVGLMFSCDSLIRPLVIHWNGTAWKAVNTPALRTNDNSSLNSIVALAANDIYAVGYQPAANGAVLTLIEHWDGNAWSVVPSPNRSTGNVLTAVTATSPADIWAVGDSVDQATTSVQTLTMHFDGAQWKIVPSPNPLPKAFLNQNVMTSVVAVSPNDVTTAGFTLDSLRQRELTLIEHWDGTRWQVVPSPNVSSNAGDLNTLHGIAAVSGTNLYAVGFFEDAGTAGQHTVLIEHFDGNAWEIIDSPKKAVAQQMNGVFALPGTGNVWGVGAFSRPGIDFDDGSLQIPQTFVLFSPIG